jgi:hypothetical protein
MATRWYSAGTIPSLLSSPGVSDVLRDLRRVGWKDWHLLNVIANLTINHRLALCHGVITAGRARQMTDAFRAEALRTEEPGDPQIASDQITRNVMEEGIRLVAMSSLHRWGLALHHGTTDSDAIMLLATRIARPRGNSPRRAKRSTALTEAAGEHRQPPPRPTGCWFAQPIRASPARAQRGTTWGKLGGSSRHCVSHDNARRRRYHGKADSGADLAAAVPAWSAIKTLSISGSRLSNLADARRCGANLAWT